MNMTLNRPNAVIFDNGRTVTCEPDRSMFSGAEQLLRRCKSGEKALPSAEEYLKSRQTVLMQLRPIADAGAEIPEAKVIHMLFDFYGINSDSSEFELEEAFWNGVSMGSPTNGIENVFDYLMSHKIKIGILSNCIYSGKTLTARMKRLFPKVSFESIISSGDYLIRKPHPFLFAASLNQLESAPENTWFCGDSVDEDVLGAVNCGMTGIWYMNRAKNRGEQQKRLLKEAISIAEWSELLWLLETAI